LYPHEIYFNSLLNYWRQRVEHTMHLIKSHGMWRAEKARNSHICLPKDLNYFDNRYQVLRYGGLARRPDSASFLF
jgi:hypothetical protein